MPRVIFTMTDEMNDALTTIAEERGAPLAVLMREALTEYLAARGVKVEKKLSWGGRRKPKDGQSESRK